ncbi:MAG: CoA pyrophosphatase [Alphaproteobacteria bacterium]|nr:CoA pyrophosphatase [Alphaproteobacteria bacterium]
MGGHIDSLKGRLLPEPPRLSLQPTRSDYDLNPDVRPRGERQLAPAAVVIPIVSRSEPTILFTRRTRHLSRHAGQVSFPGGRLHADDSSLIATALRETEEETGIAPEFITVAGFLDCYETGTGFAILPVVGLLREGFAVVPDPNEVEEVFEVPLAFLLDPASRQRRSMEWQGRKREFYAFDYGSHHIWGATAGILVNFADRVRGE